MAYSPEQIAQQLQAFRDKRIIFVHPNYTAQHVVLSQVLTNTIYVRFQGQGLSRDQLLEQLNAALEQQGGQAQLGGRIDYLVLDECERALSADLQLLLLDLLTRLTRGRVVVISRVLPDEVLDDAEIRRQSCFIPRAANMMLWDYAEDAIGVLLEVRAFGDGRVQLNGKTLASWDGALPRSLFFYLVDRGMVTRAEIFETFWPNLSTREATNVFHVTKRKISEVLGTELTVYGSGFYHISPKIQLSYDVSLFNQLVQDSEMANDGSAALRQAVALYRGDYLKMNPMEWVANRREALKQANCDALVSLGKACENSGNPHEAVGLYLRASQLKPEREDSTLAVMRLYRALKLLQDALTAYQRLVKALQPLKVPPSSQLKQLAAEIERELSM
jgi:DNA-binding SARP family transcriptional activator